MELIQLVVVAMVIVILATITLAAVSYGAFKVRERRVPAAAEADAATGPLFFERVRFAPRDRAAPR
jgi:Tfp pilus assembly protein PilE